MSLNGGDVLARGGKSAQFSVGSGSSDEPIELRNKVVAEEEQTFGVPVLDKRRHYNPLAAEAEAKPTLRLSEREFAPLQPIMDRVLIKRINDNPDLEILDDGSARDKKTNMIIPAKYRQHSNTGIVLAAGSFVVTGGVRIPMSEILKPGDKVTFGDYNSEVFHMEEHKEKALCDALGLNFLPEEGSIRIVRVQDIRGVESVK